MSNLDNILEKIHADAENEAKVILDQANREKEALLAEKKKQGEEDYHRILKKAEEEAKVAYEKVKSKNKLKSRDRILSKEEELVDVVLDQVKDQLKHMDSQAFIGYLKKSLDQLTDKGAYSLKVPEKYYQEVQKENLPVRLLEEFVDQGFVLSSGNIIYNGSFDNLIESKKDELEKMISDQLFER